MLAVIPVRHGVAPVGSDETVCEALGNVLLVGTGTATAATSLAHVATHIWLVESPPIAQVIAAAIAQVGLTAESLILPASPDGRDLAPQLAHHLRRTLFAGSIAVTTDKVSVARQGGLAIADFAPTTPFVATLQIGIRGIETHADEPIITIVEVSGPSAPSRTSSVSSVAVLPPDASTMDLSEAPRIVSGGAGLDSHQRFGELQSVSAALDASMGVTRVITDRGWAEHERQIGTTGVIVQPDLYISFGVSGAVQHTSGLGQPEHIISVNTDAHCPMMQMSDLAIVADANAVLDQLAELLGANVKEGAS